MRIKNCYKVEENIKIGMEKGLVIGVVVRVGVVG